jgi:hypothetical protein
MITRLRVKLEIPAVSTNPGGEVWGFTLAMRRLPAHEREREREREGEERLVGTHSTM